MMKEEKNNDENSFNKISLVKIDNEDVQTAIFDALSKIDAKQIMREDMNILLKPNLLIAKKPERAATTHPLIVDAVIQWVLQFKPKTIYVGDSSGGMKVGITEKVLEESGILEICNKYDKVIATSFSKTGRKDYKVPNPLVIDHINSTDLFEKADLIINLPKIKTHNLTMLTCAIKNMFGSIIIGNKGKTHLDFPNFEEFSAALADIYSVTQPQLTIIDGYLCQEGNGPSAGDVVKMDLILAGYNGVALDSVVCKIIGIDPKTILYLKKAEEKGIGTLDFESKYELVGEKIDDVKREFKLPKSMIKSIPLPKFLAKWISKNVFRPSISFDVNKCNLCGTCIRECPAGALSLPKNLDPKTETPKWDKKKCIFCYCCSELCPQEAIEFEVNLVKNVFTSNLIFLLTGGFILLIYLITLLF